MKRLLALLLFALSCPFAIAGSSFEEGTDAYRAGAYDKAFRIFTEHAARGYGSANSMLSLMYANGHGVPADPIKAREQALIAEERREPDATSIVAFLYFKGAFGEPDVANGFIWLNKGVALKDSNSMRILAVRLALGQDIAPDSERAFKLTKECLSQHRDQLCQIQMAQLYEFGFAPQGGLSSAQTHYKQAMGYDGVAEYRLGRFYELGLGTTQSYERALDYYLAAAKNHRNGAAMQRLGVMHEKGLGVPVDLVQAAAWYEKAADFNEASGNVSGGRLHLAGKGFKRDPAEALRWFQEAAERSEPVAMRALAALFAAGDGVPAQPALAMDLLCKAALIDQLRAESRLEYSVRARPAPETAYRLATLQHCGAAVPATMLKAQRLASMVNPDILQRSQAFKSRWASAGQATLAMAQDVPVVD